MTLKPILLMTAFAGLAACGGSGGGSTTAEVEMPEVEQPVSFSQLLSDFEASPALDETNDADIASFAALSAAGGASYSGQVGIFLDVEEVETSTTPNPNLLGEIALQTSFSGSEGDISGTMSNFVDRDNNAKTGTLTLSEGEIGADDGAGNLFGALFDGTLSGPGVGNQRYQGGAIGAISDEGDIVGLGFGGSFEGSDDSDVTIDNIDDLELEYLLIFTGNED